MSLYLLAATVGLLLVGLIVWQVRQLIVGYGAAIGTPWQKFLAVFSHSATILTARIGAFVTGIVGFVVSFLPILDPTSALGQSLSGVLDPKYVPWYGLIFAVIVEMARRSNGSIDPILPPPQDTVK